MKLWVAVLSVALIVLTFGAVNADAKVNREPGDIPAFIVGCCWGIREGTQWNDGSDMHWREWMRIVPIANLVIAVWDGVECYQGMTSKEWADKYGANWY
jgi:hypothetical protein